MLRDEREVTVFLAYDESMSSVIDDWSLPNLDAIYQSLSELIEETTHLQAIELLVSADSEPRMTVEYEVHKRAIEDHPSYAITKPGQPADLSPNDRTNELRLSGEIGTVEFLEAVIGKASEQNGGMNHVVLRLIQE